MTTLSVICAAPPGPNPGMHTVDLAMRGIQRRLGTEVRLRFLVLYEPGVNRKPQPDLEQQPGFEVCYEPMIGSLEQLYDSHAILYWGDFLHAFRYRQSVMEILQSRGLADSGVVAANLVGQYLFLKDAPDQVLAKTMLFGETIIFNRQADYLHDAEYREQFERLLAGVRRVWMRDVYSAHKVARVRREMTASHLGVDCSMLLCDTDVAKLPTTPWLQRRRMAPVQVGVFFGRSSGKVRPLGEFASELCQRMDMTAEWLPWGHQSTFDDIGREARRGFRRMRWFDDPEPPTLGDLLRRVKQYELVITDTYHLCLNAWRMGVPAICIGTAANANAWSVSSGKAFAWRDKRQVFLSMYDAMDYYVYTEEILNKAWRHRRVYQLANLIRCPEVAEAVTKQIRQNADSVADDLVDQLDALLTGDSVRAAVQR